MPDQLQCQSCGRSIAPSRFCAECGAPQTVGANSFRPVSPPPLPGNHGQPLGRNDLSAILDAIPWAPAGSAGNTEEKGVIPVRSAGSRVNELAARFARRMVERHLEGVLIFRAERLVNVEGLHIIVQKQLIDHWKVNFLVRFHAQGTDAILGWGRAMLPDPKERRRNIRKYLYLYLALTVIACVIFFPVGFFVGFIGFCLIFSVDHNPALGEASIQLAKDLQLSVRAALDEVIDEAQLSEFVTPISDDGTKRVI